MSVVSIGHITTPEGTIGPCVGHYGTRKRFYLDGTRLEVPEAVIDKQLRWLVDQGMGIADAYARLGWKDFLPEEGMRECCRDVLRIKWMDENQVQQLEGWGATCEGYHRCLEKYVQAIRETKKIGRMKIAQGLYSPSPDEEKCIRLRFAVHNDVARAYTECNAQEILPQFSFALESMHVSMSQDRTRAIKQPLYKVLQTAYDLSTLTTREPVHVPTLPEPTDNYSSYLWLVAIAGGIVLLTR